MNNVYQAAGFYACNNRLPPFLVYANAADYRIFTSENAPELTNNFLEEVVRDISMQHRITENLLKSAETKEELFNLTSPDFSQWCWKFESKSYLSEAKKIWGME